MANIEVARAITLTQPWAGLVASGLKLIENRDKPIIAPERFGETFGIHASRELRTAVYARIREIAPELWIGWTIDDAASWPLWYRLSRITSAVIGVATVVRAVVLTADDHVVELGKVDDAEVDLGDQRRWLFGPIGYVLRDNVALAEPVRCRGGLSNWAMPDDVASRVHAQIQTQQRGKGV